MSDIKKEKNNYIDKEEFNKVFNECNSKNKWDPFFVIVTDMARMIFHSRYYSFPNEIIEKDRAVQEAVFEVWKLILTNKIDPSKNVYSFIHGRIIYKFRDVAKEYYRRDNIIHKMDSLILNKIDWYTHREIK